MNDFEIRTNQPIKYQICGNLRASDGFLHYKRSMELHVLIVVLKGTMYLRVGGENVIVRSGQYILLRAGEEHEGWKMSEGELSYFWVHFSEQAAEGVENPGNYYHFPMLGTLPATQRVTTLFRQLLDLSRTWQEEQDRCLIIAAALF